MKILIVAKTDEGIDKMAEKLAEKLHAEVIFDNYTGQKLSADTEKVPEFDGNLIITLGGDGTFLWVASKTEKPILPVRTGGTGFLTVIDYEHLLKKVNDINKQNYRIEKWNRIKVCGIDDCLPALNEIVISRKFPSKIMNIDISIDGVNFEFRGDGVLISTVKGSTAYNSSAGGSVIDPSIDAISIVPLNSFYTALKPMVIPANKKICIKQNNSGIIVIDGYYESTTKKGQEFTIERSEPAKIVRLSEDNFYQKLKQLMKQ